MLRNREQIIQQKRELDEEIERLANFLEAGDFDKIEDVWLGIIVRQHSIMKRYSQILGESIAACPS